MFNGDPASGQLGASGIVFGMIFLNALLHLKSGRVPMTFLVQMYMWMPRPVEIRAGLRAETPTSHSAHAIGAAIGTLIGWHFHHQRVHHTVVHIIDVWLYGLINSERLFAKFIDLFLMSNLSYFACDSVYFPLYHIIYVTKGQSGENCQKCNLTGLEGGHSARQAARDARQRPQVHDRQGRRAVARRVSGEPADYQFPKPEDRCCCKQ